MVPFVKWFYLLALSVWIGSIVFLTVVVAPTVFKTLPPDDAAKLQRAIFPRYYLLGIFCAVFGIVCVGWLLADRAFGKWPGILSLLLLVSTGGTNAWLLTAVLPRLNELRERKTPVIGSGKMPEPHWEQQWKELHRMSVQLNFAVLGSVLALLFLVVFARVV
ncbi:MAG: DUF4149 domain-containing protein [Verrucomicrobia bacterium]|nr:DUF4149 domain-containing protein [Verrucomicrobiota bacterium]